MKGKEVRERAAGPTFVNQMPSIDCNPYRIYGKVSM